MRCCLTSFAPTSCPGPHNTPGFRGFQYVLAEQGRAIGILWYERAEDLEGITQLVGTWFQDHIAPRLVRPETAVRGRVVVNTTSRTLPRPNATALGLGRDGGTSLGQRFTMAIPAGP
jgi:hypothetical protein